MQTNKLSRQRLTGTPRALTPSVKLTIIIISVFQVNNLRSERFSNLLALVILLAYMWLWSLRISVDRERENQDRR